MWILKKINVGTNLVPTVQPNGVDSAPVATTRRAQREAEQAARSYLRHVAAHCTNPRVVRQQAILNVAQPGEAIRPVQRLRVQRPARTATGAMIAS